MKHQGYNLKLFIEDGGASVNEIAAVLDISRQGVNGLYGQVSLDKSYQEKLLKAGHKIPGITAPGGAEICDSSKTEGLEKRIILLEEYNHSLKEQIEMYKSKQ